MDIGDFEVWSEARAAQEIFSNRAAQEFVDGLSPEQQERFGQLAHQLVFIGCTEAPGIADSMVSDPDRLGSVLERSDDFLRRTDIVINGGKG